MGNRGRKLRWVMIAVLLAAGCVARADEPPEVPPPKPSHLPQPAVRNLPNGLKVVVIERHALPILTLRLVVESGPEADPPALPGVAQLVAALVNQGTIHRSAQEIAQAIDHVGGTMDTGAEWDDSYVALSVLTDHTDFAFDLVSDLAMNAALAPDEIERQRKQALSALEIARDDPAYVADTVLECALFTGTTYGHPEDGALEAVPRITAEDIRAFYSRYYRPANSILAVVGDITADRAFELAARYFSSWHDNPAGTPQSGAPAAAAPSGTANTQHILVIDKPDAVQTEVRVGDRGVVRGDSNYLALTVANQILGGPASNRLYQALRIEHGLTYSASSEVESYRSLGSWESKTSIRTAETVKGLRMMLDEMKRLRDHPITDFELHTAQSYLTGHLALEVESSSGLTTQMLNLLVYNLPLDYWDQFPGRVNALDQKEVLMATNHYLDLDHDIIVLVGNAAAFSNDLKKLGEFQIIPIHDLDFSSPTLERPAAAQAR